MTDSSTKKIYILIAYRPNSNFSTCRGSFNAQSDSDIFMYSTDDASDVAIEWAKLQLADMRRGDGYAERDYTLFVNGVVTYGYTNNNYAVSDDLWYDYESDSKIIENLCKIKLNELIGEEQRKFREEQRIEAEKKEELRLKLEKEKMIRERNEYLRLKQKFEY